MAEQYPEQFTSGLYRAGHLARVYVIDDGSNGMTLIDAGMPSTDEYLRAVLGSYQRDFTGINHILITHADADHVGGLGDLVEKTEARVYASQLAAEHILNRTVPEHENLVVRAVRDLQAKLIHKPVRVDEILQGGERLDIAGGIQVIATPGHSPDHLCYFWEREGVLFSGDLIGTGDRDELVLSPPGVTADAQKVRESALRVLELNPRLICPGHGIVWRAEESPEVLERFKETLRQELGA